MNDYADDLMVVEDGFGEELLPEITTEELLREISPSLRPYTDEEIENLLSETFAEMTPEEIEGFFSSLGRVAKRAGRSLVRAAPKLLPVVGGAVGTIVGGPAGTAIGGSLGQVAGNLVGRATRGRGRSRRATPRRAARRPAARRRRRSAPRRRRATGRSGVAQQVLSLVQNPAFLQSLVGRIMGDSQDGTVAIGAEGVATPYGAFMNALSVLAEQAAAEDHEHTTIDSTIPDYLLDAEGEALVDVGDAEARAEQLMALLHQEEWLEDMDTDFDEDIDDFDDFDEQEAVEDWLEAAGLMENY